MDKHTALSVSIALLSGVLTFLAVGPASGLFLIWTATIAWAAYFFLGADKKAFTSTIVCGIFGVFMAWLAAYQIANIPPKVALGFPFMAAVTVAVSVLVLCLAANLPQLSAIPMSVLGYSATFGYLLQTPDKLTQAVLTSASLDNPMILVSVSIVVGTLFGQWSGQLSAKLTK